MRFTPFTPFMSAFPAGASPTTRTRIGHRRGPASSPETHSKEDDKNSGSLGPDVPVRTWCTDVPTSTVFVEATCPSEAVMSDAVRQIIERRCPIALRASAARIFCSTPTIPWTGFRGATRRSKARTARDKPIFLSIGYSTCHWCHVMEHESFEDPTVAERAQSRFRVHQSRSRGAAGRRSRLHDVRPGDDRRRRLADERLADARSEAVFRRHVFSARRRGGARPGFVDVLTELARAWRDERDEGPALGRDDPRPAQGSDAAPIDAAPDRAPVAGPEAIEAGIAVVRPGVRPASRRLRRRAEVSAPVGADVPAPGAMR